MIDTTSINKNIDPLAPFEDASEHVKQIMKSVLELEKEMLFQTKPRLKGEVVDIIKEAVKGEA